jgi:hypothetical protein
VLLAHDGQGDRTAIEGGIENDRLTAFRILEGVAKCHGFRGGDAALEERVDHDGFGRAPAAPAAVCARGAEKRERDERKQKHRGTLHGRDGARRYTNPNRPFSLHQSLPSRGDRAPDLGSISLRKDDRRSVLDATWPD